MLHFNNTYVDWYGIKISCFQKFLLKCLGPAETDECWTYCPAVIIFSLDNSDPLFEDFKKACKLHHLAVGRVKEQI